MKLACPQCGGINQPQHPDPFIRCDFCHSSLFIDLDAVRQVFTFSPEIESQRIGLYLKTHLEKSGFHENIVINTIRPVQIPFWSSPVKNELLSGHSIFPSTAIPLPAGNQIFFERETGSGEAATVLQPNLLPANLKDPALIYIPFHEAGVIYKEKEHTFFISAITGRVYGAPLPFIPAARTLPLFPLFFLILAGFLAVNLASDRFLPLLLLNSAMGAGSFFFTDYWLAKKIQAAKTARTVQR